MNEMHSGLFRHRLGYAGTAEAAGRPRRRRRRPALVPLQGPNEGRCWYLRSTNENTSIVAGWHDIETLKRLDRPPWELKPGGS